MKPKVNILWTGGWDSTFRLLQLLFEEKSVVRPHYLIRSEECSGQEIDTMIKIRRYLFRNYPKTRDLLLPIEFVDRGKIKQNKTIADEYKRIKNEYKISKQYEELARYCNQLKINKMEIGIHKSDSALKIIEFSIFNYFSVPLRYIDKKEMADYAEKRKWTDIMSMTSFCRRPKNGKPCGLCGPCADTLRGGLGWRLPLKARIIAYLQLPFRTWWRNNYQKQNEGKLKYIAKLLKDRF